MIPKNLIIEAHKRSDLTDEQMRGIIKDSKRLARRVNTAEIQCVRGGKANYNCGMCDDVCEAELVYPDANFEYLGAGMYHTVWRHAPTGKVVKFSGSNGHYEPWTMELVLNTLKEPNTPCAPRIHHVQEFTQQGSAEYFIVLDELEMERDSEVAYVLETTLREYRAGSDVEEIFKYISTDVYAVTEEPDGYYNHRIGTLDAMRSLIEDACMYAEHVLPGGGMLDLHDANYMLDTNDNVVITDPLM